MAECEYGLSPTFFFVVVIVELMVLCIEPFLYCRLLLCGMHRVSEWGGSCLFEDFYIKFTVNLLALNML